MLMSKYEEFNLGYETRQSIAILESVGLIVCVKPSGRSTMRLDYTVTNKTGNCLLDGVNGKEFHLFSEGVAAVIRGHTDARISQ